MGPNTLVREPLIILRAPLNRDNIVPIDVAGVETNGDRLKEVIRRRLPMGLAGVIRQ